MHLCFQKKKRTEIQISNGSEDKDDIALSQDVNVTEDFFDVYDDNVN